jgi:hypothetical protein
MPREEASPREELPVIDGGAGAGEALKDGKGALDRYPARREEAGRP